ncbi:inactive ubiquitin carboxyl-terminal hydrolase 54 isoform X2 [Triticum aestivum]|nr:inactive ubiquitin carboxyl-terminal hydrolase 54-like isoform X2 [Triticum aestivum]
MHFQGTAPDRLLNIIVAFITNGEVVHGSGLKSDDDDKSCLLNVIIQSLWHLRGFRDDLLKTSSHHKHVGDPGAVSCVVCVLCHIFTELSKVSKGEGEAVAPTSLRMALSISFPAEKLIRMGQMNDASEVLEAILRRMHDSFTYRADYLAESHERNCSGSWDCANDECIAHDMFGADVHERMICYNCGLESRQQKYTSFLHYINACSLNYAMRICPGNSFDDILKAVMMDVHRTCDPDVGGCGKSNHMSHTLSSSPYVFTVGLLLRPALYLRLLVIGFKCSVCARKRKCNPCFFSSKLQIDLLFFCRKVLA